MGEAAPAAPERVSVNDRFEIRGTTFLDKAMPLPVAATCGYVCVISDHRVVAIALSVLFIAGNIGLNTTIQKRLEADESVGLLLGPTRGALALVAIPPLVWLAGSASAGWLPALPALLALPFLLTPTLAAAASLALIVLTGLARMFAGVGLEQVGLEVLGLAVASLVEVPVAGAMRRHLETLVDLQGRLKRQIERAEASNRAKSSFLAQMSHEIRTPLNGVIGSLDLLSRRHEADELLEAARSSADGLLDLVDDVLDLSKIEAGHMESQPRPTFAPSLLDQVENAFGVLASERGLALELHLDAAVPQWGTSDPVRLRQIVFNLVSNAIKFTRSGSVQVSLTDREGMLRITVRDTGRGMPPEVLERVFDPFEQAEPGQGGTGLGLSLVLRLTRLLGGRLDAYSTLGEGSTFTVDLPWPPCAPPTRATGALPEAAGLGFTVLVVEDNKVNQTVVKAMLDRLGCVPTVVETGADGVREACSGAYDFVLMDVHLPDTDGFAATREIRAAGMTTPIYALTAGVLVEDRQHAVDAGMDGFLTKPLRLGELAAALESAALSPSMSRPPRAAAASAADLDSTPPASAPA